MEELNLSFWLGLAAAIPLSIGANLVTPRIQRLLAKRDEKKSEKRRAELRAEFERVKGLTESRDLLHTHLLQNILVITFITSFFGAIAAALFALGNFFPNVRSLFQLGQVTAVVGGVSVARICLDAIRDTNRVREFDRYKAKIESEIGKIE